MKGNYHMLLNQLLLLYGISGCLMLIVVEIILYKATKLELFDKFAVILLWPGFFVIILYTLILFVIQKLKGFFYHAN
jgi:hypothetical protein